MRPQKKGPASIDASNSLTILNKVPSLSNAERLMAEVIPLVNKPGASATVNAPFVASRASADQNMVDLPLQDILPSSSAPKNKNRVKHNVLSSHSILTSPLTKITRSLFTLNNDHRYQPINQQLNSSTESLIESLQKSNTNVDSAGGGANDGCCCCSCSCSSCFK